MKRNQDPNERSDTDKILMNAPCCYRKKGKTYVPDVGCLISDKCKSCGFNPKEQKRRVKEGTRKYVPVLSVRHNELGEVISRINGDCMTITFKKREAHHA